MALSVVASTYGGPEALELRDLPVLAPGPSEVVIKIKAIGVNPVDAKIYSGARGNDPAALPLRLGFEVAGVIEHANPHTYGPTGLLQEGDHVVAFRVSGGYTERLLVPAKDVLHKPDSLSFAQAAGLLLAGTTAVHALTVVELGKDDTLLIHGGAGAVGRTAVILARLRGAHVITTSGATGVDMCQALGATAIKYGPDMRENLRSQGPYTAVLDTLGTPDAVDSSLSLLSNTRRFVTVAAPARAAAEGFLAIGSQADPGVEIRDKARVELLRLADEELLSVPIDKIFALAEVADAHRYLGSGKVRGKIILSP